MAALALAVAAEPAAGRAVGGKWIWHPNPRGSHNAPAQKRYFRRGVVIPAGRPIKTATCRMTADNEFVLFVNGKKVGSGNDWQKVYSFNVKKLLSAGRNVICPSMGR